MAFTDRDLADAMAQDMGRGRVNVFSRFEAPRPDDGNRGFSTKRPYSYADRKAYLAQQREVISLRRRAYRAWLERNGWSVEVELLAADRALYTRMNYGKKRGSRVFGPHGWIPG